VQHQQVMRLSSILMEIKAAKSIYFMNYKIAGLRLFRCPQN